jgi:hypothetical protein
MKNMILMSLVVAMLGVVARADLKTAAARETAEYIVKQFGKEAAEEGVEVMTRKVGQLASEYGDDAYRAARNAGPSTFKLVEQAGTHGDDAVKLLARAGQEGAWVVGRPASLSLFAKYGDDAAKAMIKHKGIAEPLIEGYGAAGAKALTAVNEQGGRRLATMMAEGELKQMGQNAPKVLGVVEKYGDRAMEFVWKHKGVLITGAVVTAFVANPEPYLDGLATLTDKAIVSPIASVAKEAAGKTNWTLIGALLITVVAGLSTWRAWLAHRRRV